MADTQTPQSKLETELEKKLGQIRAQGSEDTYQASAQKLNVPFSDLASAPIDTGALGLIEEADARANNLAAILKTGNSLTIATTDSDKAAKSTVVAGLKERGFSIQIIMT